MAPVRCFGAQIYRPPGPRRRMVEERKRTGVLDAMDDLEARRGKAPEKKKETSKSSDLDLDRIG